MPQLLRCGGLNGFKHIGLEYRASFRMPRIASGDGAMSRSRSGGINHFGWSRPLAVHPIRARPSCIDDHFAVLEATSGLATFIRRAELYFLEDESPLAALFTMMAGGPTWARIYRRR